MDRSDREPATAPDGRPMVCTLCGSRPVAAGETLTWVREGDGWLCPTCARRHVRDIEARLDPAWWG